MNDKQKQDTITKGTEQIKKSELKGDIKSFAKVRKVQYVGITVIFALILIVILSFGLPTFSLTSISWTKLAMLLAICCLGLFTGYVQGNEWALNRMSGLYQYTLSKYEEIYQSIFEIVCFFGQYCDELHKRKRKEYVQKILCNWGIEDLRVLDLSTDELPELIGKHYKKLWLGDELHKPSTKAYKYAVGDIGIKGEREPYVSYFDPYTKEQVDVIRGCITGYFDIEKISKEYFLNPTSKEIIDPYFGANHSQKQKTTLTITKVIARLFILVAVTIILAGLGFELYGSGEGQDGMIIIIQRIWDTGSRIFMLFTSIIYAFMIGIDVVKIDTYYLEFRRLTLIEFKQEYEKGIFVPKDKEQERVKQYQKEEKERQENLKNVIIPEKINSPLSLENNQNQLDYTKK